jgi:hypothetical protein
MKCSQHQLSKLCSNYRNEKCMSIQALSILHIVKDVVIMKLFSFIHPSISYGTKNGRNKVKVTITKTYKELDFGRVMA